MRNRYFNYIVLNHKGKIAINKRGKSDIWTNLYDFPNIETEKQFTEDQFLKSVEWKSFIKNAVYSVKSVASGYKHILSHQKIYATFWEISCEKPLSKLLQETGKIINEENIHEYAVPRLIENYLKVRDK